MTVEIKDMNNKNRKKYSSHEKILQQVNADSKKIMKNEKKSTKELDLEKKMRFYNNVIKSTELSACFIESTKASSLPSTESNPIHEDLAEFQPPIIADLFLSALL